MATLKPAARAIETNCVPDVSMYNEDNCNAELTGLYMFV